MDNTDSAGISPLPVSGPTRIMPYQTVAMNKKDVNNWMIHLLFVRQEYDEWLKMIEDILDRSKEKSE